MAYINVRVEDSTFLKLKSYNPKGAEYAAQNILEKFKDHDPAQRSLTLNPVQRQRLETLLGTAESSAEALLDRVENALRFSIEGLVVPVRESQLRKIENLASRTGRPAADILRESVEAALVAVLEA